MTGRWAARGPGASCARPRERPVLFVFGVAWRILVPRPGMGPQPTAVKTQSLNHWATSDPGTDLSKVRAQCSGPVLEEMQPYCSQRTCSRPRDTWVPEKGGDGGLSSPPTHG